MKRNTFMKRLAVTALAATMTFGSVPVTAISTFADDAVEATTNTAAVGYDDLSTVAGLTDDQNAAVKAVISSDWTTKSGDAIAEAVKTALDGKDGYVVKSTKTTSVTESTSDGLPVLVAVVDVTGTSRDGAQADGNDWNATVTITVDKATDAQKDIEKNIPAILENYFATHKIAYGSNTAAVQAQINDVVKNGLFDSIRSKDALSINVTAVDASKANQAGSVALTVTLKGKGAAENDKDGKETGKYADLTKSFTYAPEVDDELTTFEDAIKAAAKYISDNNLTLADYDAGEDGYVDYVYVQDGNTDYSTGTSDNEETVFYGRIASLINKALNDQGIYNIDVTAKNLGEIIVDKPTATTNGTVKGVVYALDRTTGSQITGSKGIDFSITLTYSDDAKLKDAKAEMDKDLQDSYTSSSALAQKIQANGSGVAASDATIAAEVKALLPDGYTVSVDSNKEATFTEEGEAKVTVTYTTENDWYDDTQVANQTVDGKLLNAQYKSTSKTVTIKLPKLKKVVLRQIDLGADTTYRRPIDGTITLNPTTTPADANSYSLVWNSNDPSVATVDQDGVVTVKGYGKVNITVRSTDDPGIYDTVTLTIQKGFDDVQNTAAFYYNPVYDAADAHITEGVTETLFGRNNDVTRAQFVTWLYKIATKYYGYDTVAADNQFTDVAASKWYAEAVTWAVKNGITSGTTATTFSPNATITRAQAVTMMWRLAGSEKYNYDNTFSDVNANKWYADAVQWAVSNGITSGNTANTFNPNGTATRAQAITFLAKGFGIGWYQENRADDVNVDK